MKRILVLLAVLALSSSPLFSQEADEPGRGAGLSVIPRVDIGGIYDGEGESFAPSFGNTSLYTLFEGNISDKWSFSVANHWIQADGWSGASFDALKLPSTDLYHFNFEGNTPNFIDWAYLCFAPGDFEFTIGKQPLLMGGFEFDNYDFDVNPFMASELWNTYTCYRPAFNAAYNIAAIESQAVLQLASGPQGFLSLGLGWNGTYGPLSIKYSALSYKTQYSNDPNELLLSLGHSLELGDFTLNLDYFNRCGDPNYLYDDDVTIAFPAVHGHTVVASLLWAPEGKWDAGIKCAFNGVDPEAPYGFFTDGTVRYPANVIDGTPYLTTDGEVKEQGTINGGAWASWYPLADSKDLRIQAAAGLNAYNYSMGGGSLFFTLGATWNFNIKLW